MNRDALLKVQAAEQQRVANLKDRILCCTVAGCLAGGAGAVRSALEHEVARQGRTAHVEICGTGCMGLCSDGPLVRSSAADAIYTNVTPADAPAIVDGIGVRAVKPDHPFFAGQRRIILANSGRADPERVEDYIAAGGYQSLLRAVTGNDSRRDCVGCAPERVARPRRCGLFDGPQMGACGASAFAAEVRGLQRRRR